MSNLYSSKPLVKPLKGGGVASNYGSFNQLDASSLKLESLNIAGVYEDGIFLNVVIQDSELRNTVIGVDGPNVGVFTQLQTRSDVIMLSNVQGASVSWDADTGLFFISSELKVSGCSLLGNIEICNNDISSANFNGDINVNPNGRGTVYINAPVYTKSSNGSSYTEMSSGGSTLLVDSNIVLYSSHGSALLSTFGGQTYSTKNGDLTFNVETGRSIVGISQVNYTDGNIVVTTNALHNLTRGNIVAISNNGLLSGNYTIGSILSDTRFTLSTTTNAVASATGGSFLKTVGNNIILNSQNQVQIPTSTKLTFGATQNAVSGSTSGLLVSSVDDITFDLPASSELAIPQTTKFQFGTSASNYINFDGSSLNVQSNNQITLSGSTTQIDTTDTRFRDPILTISDYSTSTNDNKDRGVEFRYYGTSGSMKLGWFGWKNNTNLFTFIPDATNNNETISGTPGDFELNNLTVTNVVLNPGNSINMQCGRILDASLITGCSNNITIAGSANVTLTATNRIHLASDTDVLIPSNIPLLFGTRGSSIYQNTTNNLVVASSNNISLLTLTRGSIIIPTETYVSFDGSSTGSQRMLSNTSGDLLIESGRNILLNTTNGNILVPNNTRIHFGSSSQTIQGNSTGIVMLSSSALDVQANSNMSIFSSNGSILLRALTGDVVMSVSAGSVRIPESRPLIFASTGSSNSISANTANNLVIVGNTINRIQLSSVSNIDLLATDNVNIPTNTRVRLGSDGLKVLYSDTTNSTLLVNSASNGSLQMMAPNTFLVNTGGGLYSVNNVTSVTTSSFLVTGSVGSITRLDTEHVRMSDPILTLADTNIITPDGKDRGIEYRYSNKLGWFGRKDTSGRFTFYSEAVNTNEVISGTIGDLQVNNAYLQGSLNMLGSGGIDLSCGALTNVSSIFGCSGQVSINGTNTISHNASNILLNATSKVELPFNTPLSFGDTTNSIQTNTSGVMVVKAATIVLDANLQVNGTTSTIYSTITNIQDPIFSIGGITGPIVNDNKDRGIEFKWNDGAVAKTGYFGYKSDTGRFVYIRDGINNNEIFTGAYSDVQFGNGYLQNLYLQNGVISGVSELSGGTIIVKTTSGNLLLSPTQGSSVILPYNVSLAFGNTQNSITASTSGVVTYSSLNNTQIVSTNGSINLVSPEAVRISNTIPLYFGSSNNTYILNSGGSLTMANSAGNINLTPQNSIGSINIPVYNNLNFGSTSNSIYSDGNELFINGYNAINFGSSSVNFSGNVNIVGSLTATGESFDFNDYILPLGTFQSLTITDISNVSGTLGNILVTTLQTHNLAVGDSVTLRNTNSTPSIDGTFTVTNISSATSFRFQDTGTTFSVVGTAGTVKSKLTTQQGKDVGIQVNYWSTTGNATITAGSLGFKTGFFGFKQSTERWSFYANSTISNSIVSGTLGDIEVNKVFANRLSGFTLDGDVTTGSNAVSGTNFIIGGGNINNTPIGVNTAQPGRFTTLSNTVSASFNDVTLQNTLAYSLVDKYTLSSGGVNHKSPSSASVVSMFSVVGVNFTTSSGTMPSTSIPDGTMKILVCQSMGTGCTHTIHFPSGTLIAPNPLDNNAIPTKLVFKRRSQSAQLIFDGTAWILLSSGAYVL